MTLRPQVHAEAIRGPPENHSGIYQHYGCQEPVSLARCMEVNTYVTSGDGAAIRYRPLFTYAGFRYAARIDHCAHATHA